MADRISSVLNSELLENKLAVLLEKVNLDLSKTNVAEKEQILIGFNAAITSFYKTLSNPLFVNRELTEGVVPNFKDLNTSFFTLSQDLDIVYREINALHGFLVGNFNTLNTHSSRLRSRLRKIASNLGDFRLQSLDNLGGAIYFADDFVSADKIDYRNDLYNEEKASIDIKSGAMHLPVKPRRGVTVHKINELSIGSGSNGAPGNNQEIGSLIRNQLKHIDDENPDTWYEYELVTNTETTIPLILELNIQLDKAAITNSIEVLPANFGNRNYPRITKLETSVDGKVFTDIIDEVVVSKTFNQDKDKLVSLSPEAGKSSGIVKFNFNPRKIEYVNIVIQQDDSYIIKSTSGLRFRKAIGIKELMVQGIKYLDTAEIVSTIFNPEAEINKLILISNNETTEGLTSVEHYISPNDGQDWHQIQSVEKIERDIEEILTFNLEDVEDSKQTNSPVTGVRHKALLKREATGFSARGGVEKRRDTKTQFINTAAGLQSFILEERPIASSVEITNTSFGSAGRDRSYLVAEADKIARDDFLYVYLPHLPFKPGTIEVDSEKILVDNIVWTRTTDLSAHTPVESVYEFDYLNNIIKFGDNNTGQKPESNIFFSLKRERVQITSSSSREARLNYETDGVKETINFYRLGEQENKSDFILQKRSTIHRFGVTDVQGITITADPQSLLVQEKTFLNGSQELSLSGDYSVDYIGGILYTYEETNGVDDTKVDLDFKPRTTIEQFNIIDGGFNFLNADYVSALKKQTISIVTPAKAVSLGDGYIEPKTLRFLTLSSSFKTEVPFKGDGTEFALDILPSELDGYFTIDYRKGILYSYSLISGTLVLEYNTTEYYAEYNIGVKVPLTDFKVDEEKSTVVFSDKYIINNYSDSLEARVTRNLFKIEYDYVVELEYNPRELEEYYTPFLKDYALAILTRERI